MLLEFDLKEFVKDNYAVFKWMVVIFGAPIYMPFLRALWTEFRDSMAVEGGLMGPELSDAEREAKHRELGLDDRLVNEPLAHLRSRSSTAPARAKDSRSSGALDARRAGPARPTFRRSR